MNIKINAILSLSFVWTNRAICLLSHVTNVPCAWGTDSLNLLNSFLRCLELDPLVILRLCANLLRADRMVVLRARWVDTLMVHVSISLSNVNVYDASDHPIIELAADRLNGTSPLIRSALWVTNQRGRRLCQLAASSWRVMRRSLGFGWSVSCIDEGRMDHPVATVCQLHRGV